MFNLKVFFFFFLFSKCQQSVCLPMAYAYTYICLGFEAEFDQIFK